MNDNTLHAIIIVSPLIYYGWLAWLISQQDDTKSSRIKKRILSPNIFNRRIPAKQNTPKNSSKLND